MNCNFDLQGDWRVCSVCGRKIAASTRGNVVAACRGSAFQVNQPTGYDAATQDLPCVFRGDRLEKIDCGCSDDHWRFACKQSAIGGECTLRRVPRQPGKLPTTLQNCLDCPWRLDRAQKLEHLPAITTRNLIYHVAPLTGNEGWRHNVRSLLEGADAFNGRRIIAIATGDELQAPSVVREAFGDGPWEWLEIPNDRVLREVATFLPLLKAVANTNSNEATFYAHTKGNSTGDDRLGALLWRKAMYSYLLGNWQACMHELQSHQFAGTNKIAWPADQRSPFPTYRTLDATIGDFMLAGTFYWFRHDLTFTHSRWRNIPRDRYGAEAWPSIVCRDHAAAKSMFQPWPESQYPTPCPYDPGLYDRSLATPEELADIAL